MIPSSFLSSQQFADAHLCKYYSIFFSFGLHLIYSVSEHKKPDYRLLFTHYCPAKQLFGYEQVAKRIANIRLTFVLFALVSGSVVFAGHRGFLFCWRYRGTPEEGGIGL